MGTTMYPNEVRAAGKSAQEIGETSATSASQKLNSAEKEESGAHLGGFESKTGLDSVFTWWPPAAKGLASNVTGTGGKLVSTANLYESTDAQNIDEFRYIPWDRRPH